MPERSLQWTKRIEQEGHSPHLGASHQRKSLTVPGLNQVIGNSKCRKKMTEKKIHVK